MKQLRVWLLAAIALYLAALATATAAQQLTSLQTVYASLASADGLPVIGQVEQGDGKSGTVSLPVRWREEGAARWFVVPVQMTTIQDQAIYIPRASSRVELWVNGQFAARWGQRARATR